LERTSSPVLSIKVEREGASGAFLEKALLGPKGMVAVKTLRESESGMSPSENTSEESRVLHEGGVDEQRISLKKCNNF